MKPKRANASTKRKRDEGEPAVAKPPTEKAKKTKVKQKANEDIQEIILEPGSFEIVLLLDTREVRNTKDRTYICNKLAECGVKVEVRALPLGDMVWVARKVPYVEGDVELVLDCIVERKRVDDLVASIKDGRYKEQKHRLANSGIGHVVYLVEESKMSSVWEFGVAAYQSALASTQVVDGFFVKQMQTIEESIEYLDMLTQQLMDLHKERTLYGKPYGSNVEANPNQPYLHTYDAFSRLSSKSGTLTLHDLFVKMLMTTNGISATKALEIVNLYPTPWALFDSFEALDTESARKKMIAEATDSNLIRRKRIGPVLSEALWSAWHGVLQLLDSEEEDNTLEGKRRKTVSKDMRRERREATQVNHLRTKHECTEEMIIDIEESLLSSPLGVRIQEALEKSTLCMVVPMVHPSRRRNVICWRRLVRVEWDDESQRFFPVNEHIATERHVLVYLTASELSALCREKKNGLRTYVQGLKRDFPGRQLLLLIDGADAYLSKHSCTDDQEGIAHELVWLQVVERCLIVHARGMDKVSEWVMALTENIASIPYKYVYV
jgi:ERCC4-type nuclease